MINPLMSDWTDKTPCEDPIYCSYMVSKGNCPSIDLLEIDNFLSPDRPKVVDLLLPFEDESISLFASEIY